MYPRKGKSSRRGSLHRVWSGITDSNRGQKLGRLLCYHYTNPAHCACPAGKQGNLVEATGFEPATPWSQTKCATSLRYASTFTRRRHYSKITGKCRVRKARLSRWAYAAPSMSVAPRLKTYLDLVKFEHTVFALPFAYAGMLLASMTQNGTGWPGLGVVVWVTVAMAAARTAAMGANRVIDRAIDARNPRTAGREVPAGKVSPAQAWGLVVVSLVVMAFAAAQLNPLCLALLPLAVVFLIGYPYTKRFTWLCHVWLGITDGAAAAGGYVAVTGHFAPTAWVLWAVVIFWMIGLDVIYATLDRDFDVKHGIKSIPARFGIPRALKMAAASHALTFALLLLVGVVAGASGWYYLAAVAMGAILLYEHRIVNPDDLGRVNVAFFDANMWLALTMLAGVIVDVTWRTLT